MTEEQLRRIIREELTEFRLNLAEDIMVGYRLSLAEHPVDLPTQPLGLSQSFLDQSIEPGMNSERTS